MKTKPKRSRVAAIPPPPAWARRDILRLARDSGMVLDLLYGMVIKNGIEATRTLLEEQITFIASMQNGPIDSSNEVPPEPATDQTQEPDQPVSMVNGTHRQKDNGVGDGPDNASERRPEPTESKPDDFLAELVPGPSGGEGENVT